MDVFLLVRELPVTRVPLAAPCSTKRRRPPSASPPLGLATTPLSAIPPSRCPVPGAGAPSQQAGVQGFLSARTPGALALNAQSLPPPFTTPGDCFLQYALQNFRSQVCTPVAPGSPLFAPSQVHIAVRHEHCQTFSVSSVHAMLQFWLGSAFERLSVFEVGPNVFRLVVASPEIASFLASLDGLHHGKLLALFSVPSSLAALPAVGLCLGPLAPPVTSRTVCPASSTPGPADPLARPSNSLALLAPLGQRETLPCPNPSKPPLLSRKPRRTPLCLSLLSPSILPAPPGPMPWPVPSPCSPPRDQPPYLSSPRPAPPPTLGSPPATSPLSDGQPRGGVFSPLGALGARAAMDGPSQPSYSQVASSPCKPTPPRPARTPPPLHLLHRRCFRCLASDHSVACCRDPVRCRRCRRSGHREYACKLPPPSFSAPSSPPPFSPSQSLSPSFARLPMDAAGDAAGLEAAAPLLCNLCFARDHRRSVCPLVMPAAVAIGAPAVPLAGEDSEEEEDPDEPPFDGGAIGDVAALPEAAAVDFLPLPPADVVDDAAFPVGQDSEDEEDPEELVFEDDGDGGAAAPLVAAAADFLPLPPPEVEHEGIFLPIVDAADFLAVPGQGSGAPSSVGAGDSLDLQEPARPDHVDVFMPFVNLRHFDHIAYAFINPTSVSAVEDPDAFIHQAADLGCGPDRVTLFPSAAGSRVAVFASDNDREHAVANGPFLGREASVYFRRHDETDPRFVFEHEAMAALSISHFPFEQWQRHHITHSSGPYANPHNIDPVCLTGVDFQAILVTIKAESITDIPLNLAVKNYCSIGTFCEVNIIDFEELTLRISLMPPPPREMMMSWWTSLGALLIRT
ncbi:hypothetical protein QYE76_058970 [Lolium multiflorum]|uniref:CCHC-type domain-containing protein n=1 Tax=Lolium multiflorum TaxID=4521 RepID=A0AAD8WQH1_LOLMU|nr:hypothetical protein QYE76_058970 [Lolium multiflorum]